MDGAERDGELVSEGTCIVGGEEAPDTRLRSAEEGRRGVADAEDAPERFPGDKTGIPLALLRDPGDDVTPATGVFTALEELNDGEL